MVFSVCFWATDEPLQSSGWRLYSMSILRTWLCSLGPRCPWVGEGALGALSMQDPSSLWDSPTSLLHPLLPSAQGILSGMRQIFLHVSSKHFTCTQELSPLCGVDFGNKSKKFRKALPAFLPALSFSHARKIPISIRHGEEDGERGKNETVSQLTGHLRLWVLWRAILVGLSVCGEGGVVHGRHGGWEEPGCRLQWAFNVKSGRLDLILRTRRNIERLQAGESWSPFKPVRNLDGKKN